MKERRSEYLGNKYKEIKKRKKQKKTENFTVRVCSIFPLLRLTAFLLYFYIFQHTHTQSHTEKKVLFLRIIWTLLYILPTFTLTCTTTTTNSHVGLDQALVHDKCIKNREKTHKNCKIPLFSRLLLLLLQSQNIHEHCFGIASGTFFSFHYYYFFVIFLTKKNELVVPFTHSRSDYTFA